MANQRAPAESYCWLQFDLNPVKTAALIPEVHTNTDLGYFLELTGLHWNNRRKSWEDWFCHTLSHIHTPVFFRCR